MKLKENVFNYYLLILWRILLVYIMYIICRALFIYINLDLLQPISSNEFFNIMVHGLLFDSTAIIYTNLLYIVLALFPAAFVFKLWFQKILKWIYVIFNIIALSMNLGDTIYFRFTMRRTSISILQEFQGEVNFFKIFIESAIIYWYVFLVGVFFLLVLVFLSGKYREMATFYKRKMFTEPRNIRPYLMQFITLVLLVPILIIGIRGGTSAASRPLSLVNAGDRVSKPIHTSAVLNTPFSIIRTIGKQGYVNLDLYPSYKSMADIYTPFHFPDKELRDTTTLFPITNKRMNIVVIILESFGSANVNIVNPNLKKHFTPFFDSLSREGILCVNAFANGRKSVDAFPSILASIPSMMESLAVTPYINNNVIAMPHILDSLGYYSAVLHGGPNTTMGFRAVTNLYGVKDYFGKNEYGNNEDFDGIWGIWDHKFLPYAARTISTFKEPFFATIFTLSSHHPFKMHKDFKGIFPKGSNPIQEIIAYSDYSLREFFKIIEKEEWFKNTLFVITPDHSVAGDTSPRYCTSVGSVQIPILYYSPGFIPKGEYTQTTQQIDIMPTVLGMLGYKEPFFAFGRNLAIGNQKSFAVNFGNGQYQLIMGDSLYLRNNEKMNAIYNYKTDTLLLNNLLLNKDIDEEKIENVDKYFKAFLQQYINRLIDDKLSIDKKEE